MKPIRYLNVPTIDAGFSPLIQEQQVKNASAVNFVLENYPTRRVALDVGAYVGECSHALAQHFLEVVAFEPHREAYDCLSRNLEQHHNVRTTRIAISSEKGTKYIGRSSQEKFGDFQLYQKPKPGSVRIPVFAIDDLRLENVDLVRIASFFEWERVLSGALKTISRFKPALWLPDTQHLMNTDLAMGLGALGYQRFGQSSFYTCPHGEAGATDQANAIILQRDKQKWLSFRTPRKTAVPENYFGTMIDRLYTPTTRRICRSNRGIADVLAASVPASFKVDVKHKVTLPSSEAVHINPIAVDAIDVNSPDDLIGVELIPGGIFLKLHWSAPGRFSHILIDAVPAGSARTSLCKIPIHSLANVESVTVDLPDPLLSPAETTLGVKLRGNGIESPEIIRTLDTPRKKISSHTARCYLNHGGGGNDVIKAMAEGLKCPLSYAEDGLRSGVPIVWGVLRGSRQVILEAEKLDRLWAYIDHAYFARGHMANYRISLNRFEAGPVRACPRDRLDRLDLHVEPWRRDGREILVCPPTQHFMTAHGVDSWLDDTLAELARHTDRPVAVRRKPQPGETPIPLADAFRTAYALVTHSSNIAIEAAVAGVPVYVSPTSAAAPVGSTSLSTIEQRSYPDRMAWLSHLAYSQFTFEEIRAGRAMDILLEHAEMPLLPDYSNQAR
ncbi:MAG: FkbM family methyltransferase [Methylobacterium frigidaeris]